MATPKASRWTPPAMSAKARVRISSWCAMASCGRRRPATPCCRVSRALQSYQIAQDLGIEVVQQMIPREMLYIADEVFFTGTAAEVTAIRSVDKVKVADGKIGPITRRIKSEFFGIVEGTLPDRYKWFTPVEVKQQVGA